MDAKTLIAAGIPIRDDVTEALRAEAALDWMQEHTTLRIDKADAAAIATLPATAKLFVIRFGEIMRRKAGVTSQSIEGMSQSFDASEDTAALIWAQASTLLSGYMKSQVRVTPAQRRW